MSYEASGNEQSLVITDLVNQLAGYEPQSSAEKALICSARIVQLAWEVEGLTPISDITFGNAPSEALQAADLIRQLCYDEPIKAGKPIKDVINDIESTLVIRARDLGASWEKIGKALGVSTQGAYKKHSAIRKLKNETNNDDQTKDY